MYHARAFYPRLQILRTWIRTEDYCALIPLTDVISQDPLPGTLPGGGPCSLFLHRPASRGGDISSQPADPEDDATGGDS